MLSNVSVTVSHVCSTCMLHAHVTVHAFCADGSSNADSLLAYVEGAQDAQSYSAMTAHARQCQDCS